MAQASATFLPAIDKLLGRDNYNTWSFAVKTYLEHENLWECVNPAGEDNDAQRIVKAKSKIILLIHPSNYVHIQNCVSAKEVWQKLKDTFDPYSNIDKASKLFVNGRLCEQNYDSISQIARHRGNSI